MKRSLLRKHAHRRRQAEARTAQRETFAATVMRDWIGRYSRSLRRYNARVSPALQRGNRYKPFTLA